MTETKGNKTASTEIVRDINRRIVLNLVRTHQPISRADLARLCGLQRSTISLIVEQLIEGGWVQEGATGRLPRGRRPTFLRLSSDRVVIGVDIRPTQTTVALSDVNGKFTGQEIIPTPADAAEAMEQLIRSIRRMKTAARGKKIVGVGVSLPGRFNESVDRLVFAPNLKWSECDIRHPLAQATGLHVELENAANACVLAAVWFDRVEDRNLVVVTISEGVGTGLLANGRLVRGLSGMAGEFGHVPLDPNGPACSCGGRGCWEVFASNRAALRRYAESAWGQEDLSFPELLDRAAQGERCAVKSLETMAHYIGRGMRMVVAGLAPERIIVVGELTRSWHLFGPIIEAEVRAQVLPGGSAPRLEPAKDDCNARLRGTIALVLQKHFSAPE